MEIILLCGYPASGKSTICQEYEADGYTVISRDVIGGTYKDVLKVVKKCQQKIIIDGIHITEDSRYQFIQYAKANNIPIKCILVENTMENCMINALRRQWSVHGDILWTGNTTDPHMFPPGVMFKARKQYDKPKLEEGFDQIEVRQGYVPHYDHRVYCNKAIFFDIDGTLRKTDHLQHKYPIHPDEVEPYMDVNIMKKILDKKIKKGYRFVGVSNQSGISKGTVTQETVRACMEMTKEMLNIEIDIRWCPHSPAPITCWCRKPQSGLGVYFIEKYKLNPRKCRMIGDQTTDRTFAERLGIKFKHVSELFCI
jgi:HAD superfamily hydrolase (TIGR01662 family)